MVRENDDNFLIVTLRHPESQVSVVFENPQPKFSNSVSVWVDPIGLGLFQFFHQFFRVFLEDFNEPLPVVVHFFIAKCFNEIHFRRCRISLLWSEIAGPNFPDGSIICFGPGVSIREGLKLMKDVTIELLHFFNKKLI